MVVLFGRGHVSGRGLAAVMLLLTTVLRVLSVCWSPQEEAIVIVVLSSLADIVACFAILQGECVLEGASVSIVRRSVLGFVVSRRDQLRPSALVVVDGRRAQRAGAPGGLLELRGDAGEPLLLVKYSDATRRAADIAGFSAALPGVSVVVG